MLSRILAIFSVSLIITKTADGAPAVAKARQFLPTLPGYIPVYIRNGDTPLEDINPDLAEAFNSYPSKHARYAFSRSNNEINEKSDTEVKPDSRDGIKEDIRDTPFRDLLSTEEKSSGDKYPHFQHIQKIPRP